MLVSKKDLSKQFPEVVSELTKEMDRQHSLSENEDFALRQKDRLIILQQRKRKKNMV